MPLLKARSKFSWIGKRAAAERNHLRASGAHACNALAQRGGFHFAERGLAASVENVGDGAAGGLFDILVEIEKAPAQLVGKSAAHGGFTASHESHQIDPRG